jgi:hypothetical protein
MFITEQMSFKRSLKIFGKRGANSVVSEHRQLDRMNAIISRDKATMSSE